MYFVKKDQYYRVDVKLKDTVSRKMVNKELKKVFHSLPEEIAWVERGKAFKAMGLYGNTQKQKSGDKGGSKKK